MDDLNFTRVYDASRSAFCLADKKTGAPLPLPPVMREPIQDRDKNPRGVRHPFKTAQDYVSADKRPRKQLADRQREWISKNKPTCSADYAKMPR